MTLTLSRTIAPCSEDLLVVGGVLKADGHIEFCKPNNIVRFNPGTRTQRGEKLSAGSARQMNLQYLAYQGAGIWAFEGHADARDTAEDAIEVLEAMISELHDKPSEELASDMALRGILETLDALTLDALGQLEQQIQVLREEKEAASTRPVSPYRQQRSVDLKGDMEAQWERVSKESAEKERVSKAAAEMRQRTQRRAATSSSMWCSKCGGPCSIGGKVCDSCLDEAYQ